MPLLFLVYETTQPPGRNFLPLIYIINVLPQHRVNTLQNIIDGTLDYNLLIFIILYIRLSVR